MNKKAHTGIIMAALFVCYLLFLAVLAITQGLKIELEALKYTHAASLILQGETSQVVTAFLPFFSFILFLTPFSMTGYVMTALLVQVALSFIAAMHLKKISSYLSGNKNYGWAAMVLFLFNHSLQTWTITLYSESFFTSLSILFLSLLIQKTNTRKSRLLFLAATGLILLFSRPQGILFVLPALFYILEKQTYITGKKISIFFMLTSILLFTWIMVRPVNCHDVYKPIRESAVICGFPEAKITEFTAGECTIWEAHTGILNEKGWKHELILFLKKIRSFLTLTRPYYSDRHNLLNSFNYLILLLSCIPLLRKTNIPAESRLFFRIILLNMMIVAITYDEWHGRYLSVLLPVFILLSLYGLNSLFQKREKESIPGDTA